MCASECHLWKPKKRALAPLVQSWWQLCAAFRGFWDWGGGPLGGQRELFTPLWVISSASLFTHLRPLRSTNVSNLKNPELLTVFFAACGFWSFHPSVHLSVCLYFKLFCHVVAWHQIQHTAQVCSILHPSASQFQSIGMSHRAQHSILFWYFVLDPFSVAVLREERACLILELVVSHPGELA